MKLETARQYAALALDLARKAAELGEVPVGAIVVRKGEVIGRGHNQPRTLHDPTAHAEIMAIRQACAALGSDRLTGCELWVTLEPCAIARLHYAASDPKGGAVEHGPRLFHQPTVLHKPEVYAGVGEEEAAALLREFFAARR